MSVSPIQTLIGETLVKADTCKGDTSLTQI